MDKSAGSGPVICPVVLSGGPGTRLWPLSRASYPKQFLNLFGAHSLLLQTFSRLGGLPISSPLVVCNDQHRFLVAEQLRESGMEASILLEPVGRNTAPAIAVAAMQLLESVEPCEVPLMLVLPADHNIEDVETFHRAVLSVIPAVQSGKIATLGIVPDSANTGFGYIRANTCVESADCSVFSVAEFVEKPDSETAKRYVADGCYYWNSGMFLFRADVYLTALKRFRPDIYSASLAAFGGASADLDFIRLDKQAFEACPSESIDYAVMEPLCTSDPDAVIMAPLYAGWSDVGSWNALWSLADKDENGNATLDASGQGVDAAGILSRPSVVMEQSSNCFIAHQQRLVTVLGLENVVIVDTDDALLVAHKDKVQDVKLIVEKLHSQGAPELDSHRRVYRPWGRYDLIGEGERYQVKRLVVRPGGCLSVQLHHHRAEHWVVVSGTARVTNGDSSYLVSENQSTYIPIGQIHALENPGDAELVLIEVQSGSYLGEDDIVRLKDLYGRA
ncbi:mannose-1-phosphate guanylyltransferase/mannose-6-phosphate isomerase [Oceanobacter kriegii]|uniref:mannose-1-phosphate guanylyltransferase/mannose-6-phosphate isomerase n=1 Tax=Oceanobacter kriegii TaxID=64972 RepID=UPI000413EC26|nr:mannose-1-phosphate guanylyltransferase/mannose-6-phosphate isomerase [Oceanobacter kriegii]